MSWKCKLNQCIRLLINCIKVVLNRVIERQMSGINLGRNPPTLPYQTNSQRTLIYDLKSELTNLKTEFSRLISKPVQGIAGSKVETKAVLKSRYSDSNHYQETKSNPNAVSQCEFYTRQPGTTLYDNSRSQRITFDSGFQKWNNNIPRKSPTSQDYYPNQIRKTNNNPSNRAKETKYSQSTNITPSKNPKPYQAINFREVANGRIEYTQKDGTKTSKISKMSIDPSQHNNSVQKTQKFELSKNQEHDRKNELQTKMIEVQQLTLKMSHLQKQFRESEIKNSQKDEKIKKLEESMRELTQKLIKSNEQILEISRDKNKQIQIIKQGQATQLKNQQRFYENKLSADKNNSQLKYEGEIKSVKEVYENKLLESVKEKEEMAKKMEIQQNKIEKLSGSVSELEKQKIALQYALSTMKIDLNKQNQAIKSLLENQSRLQTQLKQKPQIKSQVSKERKQMGINCQQKMQQVVQNGCGQVNLQQQNKQLQDKLSIYLNNIDKQSQKLKEQKAELEKNQKLVEDCNKIITEKQGVIRNLMRDCKVLQKDLIETKRMKQILETLLQNSNQTIAKMHMEILSQKFQ